jgi:hypothetical protein
MFFNTSFFHHENKNKFQWYRKALHGKLGHGENHWGFCRVDIQNIFSEQETPNFLLIFSTQEINVESYNGIPVLRIVFTAFILNIPHAKT